MKSINLAHKYSAPLQLSKIETQSQVMPERTTKLQTLIARFVNGQPIGDQLRNMGYNPLERNPLQTKGLDLADIPQIMRENTARISTIQEEIKRNQAEMQKAKQQEMNQQLNENKVEI